MRLSAWRAAAPQKDAGSAKVATVVDPVLQAFGAGDDPHCWVTWGDEPGVRYSILVPTDPGLIHAFVRVNVPGEGPRATIKLVRWNRVAIGELAVDTQRGHRILSFQVEQQVLRGVDEQADRVAAFGLRVIAAADGRALPAVEEDDRRRRRPTARPGAAGTRTADRSKPTPSPKAKVAAKAGTTTATSSGVVPAAPV